MKRGCAPETQDRIIFEFLKQQRVVIVDRSHTGLSRGESKHLGKEVDRGGFSFSVFGLLVTQKKKRIVK